MATLGRYLVISDLQIPFENEHALAFCKKLKTEFRIAPENVFCVGDELDQYYGSRFPKDPDAPITPREELRLARAHLRPWYDAFPMMRLATSNHGLRWLKKATAAEIPSELLRSYREIIDAPAGWEWRDVWRIRGEKHPFDMIHGMGFGGQYAYRTAPLVRAVSTVFGHIHSHAGIAHLATDNLHRWGMNTGALIDIESFAFHYNKWQAFRPCLGCGIILDGGLTPIWIPLERFL